MSDYFAFIISAFLIALALSLFIAYGFRNGPLRNFWLSFLVIFLGIWAAGLWIRPVGPVVYGVAWVPLFFVGMLITALLASFAPAANDEEDIAIDQEKAKKKEREKNAGAVGLIFWLFILITIISIVLGYAL